MDQAGTLWEIESMCYLCSGCVAPGSALRMSERVVRRGVTGLSVKRCEGDLFTLGRHITLMGLEQSGSRSAPWLLQDLVRIHKQTVVHPALPPPPSPLPCFAGLSSDVWQADQVTANRQ